jgi:sodium-dependent dicarboxylate transporter 2/3/5
LPEDDGKGLKKVFRDEYDKLGPISFAEISVSILFITLIILWFARDPGFAPGYSSLFKEGYVLDSFPAVLVSTLLFVFPSEKPDWMCFRGVKGRAKRVPALLDWQTVSTRMPWGPLFILGGGFALAKGFDVSGLTAWIGDLLTVLNVLPAWSIAILVAIFVSFLTEITSNSAVINVVTPILIAMATDLQINPLYLLLSAGMAASYAFMLPIATPPNAIVFSYGRLRVVDMARTGVILNFLCICVVTLGINTWGAAIFHLGKLPWIIGGGNGTTLTTAGASSCLL